MTYPAARYRLFAFLLAISIVLAACQPPRADPAARPTPEPTNLPNPSKISFPTATAAVSPTPLPQLQVNAEKLKGVEITFAHPWMGDISSQVTSIVDEFNQSNVWGIHVKTVAPGSPAQMYDQVTADLKAGSGPQIVAAPIEQLAAWQDGSKSLVDLNEYVNDPQWGFKTEEISDFSPAFWEQDVIEGRRLGIPALRDTRLILYNQTWAEELGFSSSPTTPQDFQMQACAATKVNAANPDPDIHGTGGWIIDNSPMTLASFLPGFGMSELTGLGSPNAAFNTPEVRQMFTFLRQTFDKSCAWNSRLPTPYEYFADRLTLLYSGNLDDVIAQERAQLQLKKNDRWEVIPFPGKSGNPSVVSSGPSYAVMNSSPEQQLAAWLFIRWMSLPRNQANLVRASSAWPVGNAAIDLLADFRSENPQWDTTLVLIPQSIPAPRSPAWRITRNIFQDAAWQVFQPNVTTDQVPMILEQLDRTVPEVLQKNQ